MSVDKVLETKSDNMTRMSFRSMYDRCAVRVNRYLLARTGREDVAEDITQDVFLAIWQARKQLREVRACDAWVFRVTKNKLVDYYRRRAREESQTYNICASPESSARQYEPERESCYLSEYHDARAGLNLEKQKLLDLLYYFSLTYEEAANLSGVPIGTFKRRLHDIRTQLRLPAGRGYSKVLTGSQQRRLPTTRKTPVQYDLPGVNRVKIANFHFLRDLTMDVYFPPAFRFDTLLPIVIFVMGYSNKEFQSFAGIKLKDMAAYRSWGQLVAASGMIGISYETDEPYEDIRSLIDFIRLRGRILGMDCSRICIWLCSDNVGTALDVLTETQRPYSESIRCGVIYYPVFRRKQGLGSPSDNQLSERFRADVPLFYVEVGKEALQNKATADLFSRQIRSSGAPLEYVKYTEAVHGFDMYTKNQRTREIIDRTLAFMKRHLDS
jgi:RNA polymerase sigma-70 factor, ECF subfamily